MNITLNPQDQLGTWQLRDRARPQAVWSSQWAKHGFYIHKWLEKSEESWIATHHNDMKFKCWFYWKTAMAATHLLSLPHPLIWECTFVLINLCALLGGKKTKEDSHTHLLNFFFFFIIDVKLSGKLINPCSRSLWVIYTHFANKWIEAAEKLYVTHSKTDQGLNPLCIKITTITALTTILIKQ